MAEISRSEEMEVGDWAHVFEWEIKGADPEGVWALMGDFASAEKCVPKLVERCEIVEGEPQKAGCIRKLLMKGGAGEAEGTFVQEKLLSLDNLDHRMSYSVVAGTTTPGISLLVDSYAGTFELSPLQRCEKGTKGTLLRWRYVCRPVSTMSQEQTRDMLLSLYQAVVAALKESLSLPDDSVTLISSKPTIS